MRDLVHVCTNAVQTQPKSSRSNDGLCCSASSSQRQRRSRHAADCAARQRMQARGLVRRKAVRQRGSRGPTVTATTVGKEGSGPCIVWVARRRCVRGSVSSYRSTVNMAGGMQRPVAAMLSPAVVQRHRHRGFGNRRRQHLPPVCPVARAAAGRRRTDAVPTVVHSAV